MGAELPKTLNVIAGIVSLVAGMVLAQPVKAQDALWTTYFNSAETNYQQGNYLECEKLLNSASLAARKYDDSLITYYYLGRVCERLNKPQEAEKNYKTVLENLGPKIWATLRPPDGTIEWDQMESIASEHTMSSHDFFKRFRHQKQPLQTRLAKPITTVDVLTDIGLLMQEQGRNQEAEQNFRQALMLSELRQETASYTQPRIMQRLAKLYATEGRQTESNALYKQLEESRARFMPGFEDLVSKNIRDINRIGKNKSLVSTRLNNLALFCATHGDYSKAYELYGRALDANDAHSADRSVIMRNYADLLESMGKSEEAKRYIRQADGSNALAAMRETTSKNVVQRAASSAQRDVSTETGADTSSNTSADTSTSK